MNNGYMVLLSDKLNKTIISPLICYQETLSKQRIAVRATTLFKCFKPFPNTLIHTQSQREENNYNKMKNLAMFSCV